MAGMEDFWDELGIPLPDQLSQIEEAVLTFLRGRGYAESEAWFGGLQYGVVEVQVRSAQLRLLLADSDELTEAVKAVAPELEVRIRRAAS